MSYHLNSLTVFIIVFYSLFLSSGLFAQESKEINMTTDSIYIFFNNQRIIYPHEKIYAQLDKSTYIAGEDIWFRAYIVDAATHQPDLGSRYVYAELINHQKKIEARVKVRVEEESYQGYIPIPETLPEGEYQLRFYTRYMEQAGEKNFFQRPIRIGTLAQMESVPENKIKNESDYEITFFPEGGATPVGANVRLAFKVLNKKGLGEDITGEVVNQVGETLFPFATVHLGMGSFSYIHPEGEMLYAICRNKEGIEKKVQLPTPETDAIALQVIRNKDRIYVKINHNPAKELPESLSIIINSRGIIRYADSWDYSREALVLSEDVFPSGVSQILLVDKNGNPVSERLIFQHINRELATTGFSTSTPEYGQREKIDIQIFLSDQAGNPLLGNFSVAVTDDRDIKPDSTIHILSTFLLSSELKGYIESPAYYFKDTNSKTLHFLDNLMLTQGWSRYRVSDVLKGKMEYPIRGKEWGMEITGKVNGGIFLHQAKKGYPVSLISNSPFFYQETETEENGIFCFRNFEIIDSMRLAIQGKNRKGSTGVELLVDEEIFPRIHLAPSPREITDSAFYQKYLQKADNQLLLTKGIRTLHLADVVVTANAKPEKGLSNYSSLMNEIYSEDFLNEKNHTTLLELLKEMPGIVASEEKVYFARNYATGNQPVIVLDNKIIENEEIQFISFQDIAEIEFVKDASSSFISGGSSGGAILVTTKRGERTPVPKEVYHIKYITPLGVQITKEFYSPSYEVAGPTNYVDPDLRTTLYWNPLIKTDSEGKALFSFYSGEPFTSYSVVIEGVTNEGKLIHSVRKIYGK